MMLLVAVMASASLMAVGLLGFSGGPDSLESAGIAEEIAENTVSFDKTHWIAIVMIAITLPFVFLSMRGGGEG
jgi:hypothetical protein